ncbi:conserved hypothetical protein [Hyella patelloides LEGE 07179]|uniref:tRNA-guanine(15) transglycosylase-like domain-containing protein n=1 Tax=Hyella patelloides LEGE 07179 TaxID=945734 RepID=A0A563W2J6_9CYAN|nr:hypothetical protein [Hyella patelloides]VEP17908.1 conserved hypothetical protein [Hyella patelloides LEGE 07179]
MQLDEICQIRNIPIVDVSTPLIIPSFSSRGFPDLKYIYEQTKDYITDVSLVSAYDLYHQYLEAEIYSSDLIFIDSGGYETQQIQSTSNLDDIYACKNSYSIKSWNLDLHKTVLKQLEPNSQFVFVSYDNWDNPQSTIYQIESALELFANFPEAASNFLYKSESRGSRYIDIIELLKYAEKLSSFSILGITEKELGGSILERCQNLLKIRSALNEKGISIPIHIFGCLDPGLIIAYFLCGADIFDGLAWLRYVFKEGLALYPSTVTLRDRNWGDLEQDLTKSSSINNVLELESLSRAMTRFAQNRLTSELMQCSKIMPNIIDLVKEAGLKIEV